MEEEQILLKIDIPPPSQGPGLPGLLVLFLLPAPPPPAPAGVKCVAFVSPCLLLINSEEKNEI